MFYPMLATEEKVKLLAENILTTKAVWFQTEYMGSHKTRMSLRGVLLDINKNKKNLGPSL